MNRSIPESSYCAVAPGHPIHGPYHDLEYGFPLKEDDRLFERLVLEINQAGLSWATILKKREGLRAGYAGFRVADVASFGEEDRERLLHDPGVIRNRLKVDAAMANARTIRELQDRFGSFSAWLDHHHPLSRAEWVRLFKKTFRFTGGEITGEFLMSTGYLPGAHEPACPIFDTIKELGPPWVEAVIPGAP